MNHHLEQRFVFDASLSLFFSINTFFQNDHCAYLHAEILCLRCEGRGGADHGHLLGHSAVDGEGIPEVLLGNELHYQLHILLALRIVQAVLRPLQSLQHLRHFCRGAETVRGTVERQNRDTEARLSSCILGVLIVVGVPSVFKGLIKSYGDF